MTGWHVTAPSLSQIRVSSSFGCASISRRLVAAVEQWWRKWLTVQTREGGEQTPAAVLPWFVLVVLVLFRLHRSRWGFRCCCVFCRNGVDHGVRESGEDAETMLCVFRREDGGWNLQLLRGQVRDGARTNGVAGSLMTALDYVLPARMVMATLVWSCCWLLERWWKAHKS